MVSYAFGNGRIICQQEVPRDCLLTRVYEIHLIMISCNASHGKDITWQRYHLMVHIPFVSAFTSVEYKVITVKEALSASGFVYIDFDTTC